MGIDNEEERPVRALSCDSKTVGKEELFVAIEGKKESGYAYKEEALKKGAWVLSERVDPECFQIEDARESYALLCHAFAGQPGLSMKLIGITGTNGKSTTAALIRSVLASQGIESALIGTDGIQIRNEHWQTENTTPRSDWIAAALKRCQKQNIEVAVMELSSMALEQKRVSGCLFDLLIYTNLARDHIEEHGSFERYVQAKRSALTLLKPNGVMIYNQDDPLLCEFAHFCDRAKLTYGMTSDQFKIESIEETVEGTTFFLNGTKLWIPLLSRVNVYNCTAALAAGFALDLSWSRMLKWTQNCIGAVGRFEKVDGPLNLFIDYAHTEKAMEEVLRTFSGLKKQGKLIVVFGCGGQRDHQKRPRMGRLACQYADHVILTNDNPRGEDPMEILRQIQAGCDGRETVEPDRVKAIKKAMNMAEKDDIIILVGKGAETTQSILESKRMMNDKAIVLSILKGEERS